MELGETGDKPGAHVLDRLPHDAQVVQGSHDLGGLLFSVHSLRLPALSPDAGVGCKEYPFSFGQQTRCPIFSSYWEVVVRWGWIGAVSAIVFIGCAGWLAVRYFSNQTSNHQVVTLAFLALIGIATSIIGAVCARVAERARR